MSSQQLALNIGLAPQPDFSHFCAESNTEAKAFLEKTAQTLIDLPPTAPAASDPLIPCYLWGTEGTGKTHLLQSIALLLESHGLRTGWMDSGRHLGRARAGIEFDENWVAVLFDDIHTYSERQQKIAFNWFVNAAHPASGNPRWIVATGQMPAAALPVRADLRSRLIGGFNWELRPLDDQARKRVLQHQARERGLHLSDEVSHYLLTHFARDLNNLTTLLARLDAYALRTQRGISVPMLKQMLHDMP